MQRVRAFFGFTALIGILASLNMLAFTPQASAPKVVVPLIVGIAAGVAWLLLYSGSVVRVAKDTRTTGGLTAIVSTMLFLGICIVLYAFASHWNRTFDLTQEGLRELAPQTVQVLQSLDQDVNVLCFFAVGGNSELSAARDRTTRFMERCKRYSWRFKYEVLDLEADYQRLVSLGMTRVPGPQGTIVLTCGGRNRVIGLSGTNPRLEERDFTNGLINVIRDARPKIYFLSGHRERDPMDADPNSGYSLLKAVLERESYIVEKYTISVTDPQLPADCSILFIARPMSDLHPMEIQVIQQYIDGGGRMIALFEPSLKQGAAPETFRPWLEAQYGIKVGENILVSKYNRIPDEIQLFDLEGASSLSYPELNDPTQAFGGSYGVDSPISRGFNLPMLLRTVRTVSLEAPENLPPNVTGNVLLSTLPETWAETDLMALQTNKKASPCSDETIKSYTAGVAVTVKTDVPVGDTGLTRDGRIVVIGDSDFLTNNYIQQITGNWNFVANAIGWLSENEDLIAIRPASNVDQAILLTETDKQFISWFSTLGVLQVVVAAAVISYIRRRRHQ